MSYIEYAIIWATLTLMPGPDILFVLTESMKNGVSNGLKIASGLVSGLAFHLTIVLSGVSILVARNLYLLNIVKYVGCFYLIYIGVKAVCKSYKIQENTESKESKENKRHRKELGYNPYKRGVIMNVTNPKLLIFFMSFIPQFIDTSNINIWQGVVICTITVVIPIIIFYLVAFFSSKLSAYLKAHVTTHSNTSKIFAFAELIIYGTISILLITGN